MSLKFFAQKVLGIKIFNPKIQDLNTSILIYSIKQTLRPKKYSTDLLTQKIPRVLILQQKNSSDTLVMYSKDISDVTYCF